MANAAQRAVDLAGIVNTLRASGLSSVRSIAEALNEHGIPAPRGDAWTLPPLPPMNAKKYFVLSKSGAGSLPLGAV
jgi:hypothetical protein